MVQLSGSPYGINGKQRKHILILSLMLFCTQQRMLFAETKSTRAQASTCIIYLIYQHEIPQNECIIVHIKWADTTIFNSSSSLAYEGSEENSISSLCYHPTSELCFFLLFTALSGGLFGSINFHVGTWK